MTSIQEGPQIYKGALTGMKKKVGALNFLFMPIKCLWQAQNFSRSKMPFSHYLFTFPGFPFII